jgi:hypothetical protein
VVDRRPEESATPAFIKAAAFRELDGLTSLASAKTKGVGAIKLLNAQRESQTERKIGLLEPLGEE